MHLVFIVARDWTLRAGVRAELREKGIDALGLESMDDLAMALAAGQTPTALMIEAGAEGTQTAAAAQLMRRFPSLFVASRADKFDLPAGVILLYRPVRVGEIVERVIEIVKGLPA